MSGKLAESRDTPHTPADDLGSVYWVYLWVNLLFKKHSLPRPRIASILGSVFDTRSYDGTGGNAKGGFLVARLDLQNPDFEDCPKLGPLLRRLAVMLSWRYRKRG
jgi:hypothetical protein